MDNLLYLEILTRLTNLIRVVTITEVSYSDAKAKVKFNNIETPFLNWLAFAAGKNYTYSAPDINEQALLLSPQGDINQGIILTGIYQDAFAISGKKDKNNLIVFDDNTKLNYDSNTKKLLIDVQGTTLIIENKKIKIKGDLEIDGEIKATKDISAGPLNISLLKHKHPSNNTIAVP